MMQIERQRRPMMPTRNRARKTAITPDARETGLRALGGRSDTVGGWLT
jgi:hypothetical protein